MNPWLAKDELGIGMEIDDRIAQEHEKRKVSVGEAVKAMVLNGLGFVNQRLYLVPSFFENKPTERLIGKGIMAEHLNDDVLGRALDALYAYGVTKLYHHIALQAAKRLGLTSRFAHLDSSSFHVDGTYPWRAKDDTAPDEDAGIIHITKGYSRDHRPELNQVMLDLVAENQAGIPVLMKPLSGNTSDARDFRAVITEHVKQLQEAHEIPYLVADPWRAKDAFQPGELAGDAAGWYQVAHARTCHPNGSQSGTRAGRAKGTDPPSRGLQLPNLAQRLRRGAAALAAHLLRGGQCPRPNAGA